MTIEQIATDILQKKSQKLLSQKEEKILLLETLHILKLMTEFFRGDCPDFNISLGHAENLEWDSNLQRFVYHRGETSQFLELARKDILFRVRPYLQELMKKAKEALRNEMPA